MKQGKIVEFKAGEYRAIADLGSNTFHLMVGHFSEGKSEILLQRREAVGIGINGMEQKRILPDALERAINTLISFAEDLDKLGIKSSEADVYATSAFRNAENAAEVADIIKARTGFCPRIITGQEEADLIFQGVMNSGAIRDGENSLVVDIGGGSVEFILCKGRIPVWKESLEVGGLRLMEQFHLIDPMPAESQAALIFYLRNILQPVHERMKQIDGLQLIGCSGTFDTLIDMRNAAQYDSHQAAELKSWHQLKKTEFFGLYNRVLPLSLEERLQLPGMIPLRAGMMVVALILVNVLLEEIPSETIRISTWSLKEGALVQAFKNRGHAIV